MGGRAYHAGSSGRTGAITRAEILAARPDLAASYDAASAAFPVRVTASWWARMDPSDPADPLAIQALPDPREAVLVEGDVADPVGDAARSPVPWVVHKYPDRVLWMLTKRCHLDCRYCFRRDHNPAEAADPTPEAWERAVAYVRTCGASEVILSGGDPLAVTDRALFAAIDAVRSAVPRVRIHTRAPITCPSRVTTRLAEGLAARLPLRVVVHVNHPRELAPDVDEALGRLRDAGAEVLNQSVLLRGVNDDVDTLVALVDALAERHVVPYYLHVTDAAKGTSHLRVGAEEASRLHRALRDRVAADRLPRCVVDPPDGSGKVDVEAFLAG